MRLMPCEITPNKTALNALQDVGQMESGEETTAEWGKDTNFRDRQARKPQGILFARPQASCHRAKCYRQFADCREVKI
jgi:hypothetical protein